MLRLLYNYRIITLADYLFFDTGRLFLNTCYFIDAEDKSIPLRFPALFLLFLFQNNIFQIFRVVPIDSMRTCVGDGAKFQAYSNSVLYEGEWPSSQTGRFYPGRKPPKYPPKMRLSGPQVGLDALEKRRVSYPCRKLNHYSWDCSP